jgi:hypothetical protein
VFWQELVVYQCMRWCKMEEENIAAYSFFGRTGWDTGQRHPTCPNGLQWWASRNPLVAKMMSKCYYDFIRFYCWNLIKIIAKMLSKLCWNAVKMMLKCCKNNAQMLSKYFCFFKSISISCKIWNSIIFLIYTNYLFQNQINLLKLSVKHNNMKHG